MNKTLLVIGAILAGIGLFVGGLFFGRANAQTNWSGWMMGDWNQESIPAMMGRTEGQHGPGMMNGTGMMGNWSGMGGANVMSSAMMGNMMNGGMMGDSQYTSSMMGGFEGATNADPLSIEEAQTAVTDYLTALNNDNLGSGEIMIFDNHAYAQIIDESTGAGAFEVLVDPVTRNVFPEPGPNMMWNTDYGMMAGSGSDMMGNMMKGQPGVGMMGGNMMGDFGYTPETKINVTASEATAVAQEYLDAYLPGKTADDHADAFPGYYTLHVLDDGEVAGMLSVHATTGQVFLHHWHGNLSK